MQITPLFATQAQDSASGDRAEIAGDFDQFLMLLTTQLQNQDPLSPLDATEFTNQLVAFSEVEQSVKANENLENLIALQGASKAESAISLVGKKVDVLSEVFQHDGETSELFYQLEEPASGLAIQVYNSSGALVRTMTGDMSDGLNRFEWDGKDNDGDTLPEGLYAFRVIAARA
ncbi:MAG: flagellar hook assembly protein FlgD, partial [Pirellulales bacterium]|nr:flagellar hook assembly protein FlgD [Pirellulales bacterium]